MRVDSILKKNAAAVVFLVSLAFRLMLDLVFILRFGWHAVNHVETWLYVGVAHGTHFPANGVRDPTTWILRFVGALMPGDMTLYGVVLLSALLSAFTAMLLYLLMRQLYDVKTAFIAGMIYGGMVEPLSLSLMGFTHDHLQLAVVVGSLLLVVKAAKSGFWRGLLLSLAYVAVVEASKMVNDTILFGIGVAGVYVGYTTLEYLRSKFLGKRMADILYPLYIAFAVALLLGFGGRIIPAILESELGGLPQGRMGSADVVPMGLLTFFLRYNPLIFLLPYAFVAAYGRKDTIGITLTILGLMMATVMDRGTRISDIGIAMLLAYALADWGVKLKRIVFSSLAFTTAVAGVIITLLSSGVGVLKGLVMLISLSVLMAFLYKHKRRVTVDGLERNVGAVFIASISCLGALYSILTWNVAPWWFWVLVFAGFILAAFFLSYPQFRLNAAILFSLVILAFSYASLSRAVFDPFVRGVYSSIFLLGVAATLYVIYKWVGDKRVLAVVALVLVAGFVTNLAYIYTLEGRRLVSEGDYVILKWLKDNNHGGRILTAWDYGYMAEVVSGLKSVSTPAKIEKGVHDMVWMPYRQAAVNFRKSNVSYILLKSESFDVVKGVDGLAYRIMGGFVMTPDHVPPIDFSNRYTIYKLRHKTADRYFKLLRNETDPVTGMEYLLYEVDLEPTPLEMNSSIAGAIAINVGAAKTARMIISTVEIRNNTFNRTYHLLNNEQFGENEVKELTYPVVGLDRFNCDLMAGAPRNGGWKSSGILTYQNPRPRMDTNITVSISEARTLRQVESYKTIVQFDTGQKKSIKYYFNYMEPYVDYVLDVKASPGLQLVANESTNPLMEDVRIVEVFC
ncbi:MAG: glycosyltransferase family 39 protein [Candidatus Altiarchaeota archaeon]